MSFMFNGQPDQARTYTDKELQRVAPALAFFQALSPENDARTALLQRQVDEGNETDAYAQQHLGAPNSATARLQMDYNHGAMMEAYRKQQEEMMNEHAGQIQDERNFAQAHGYPSLNAYRLESSEKDRQDARAALEASKTQAEQDRLVEMVSRHPLWFQKASPKVPVMPSELMALRLFLKQHPEMSGQFPAESNP